ncbi:MAG TPA: VWA domain-containing protein [Spirochaetales bacterium]|nr:VWA domain-containing protein [Spirochaetales bacterium]HOT58173.1 VWA domain-containing protein [Spirochaetales bacterium]HPD79894.1 VWA domain-containing protein [Spirochaetales bacterium]HQK33251.1 VWA domain-containing protein [Spirochaetales bacterium]HRV27464.1 VWA domain-containing protein [Spirochaetia bacterium]
MKQSNTFQCRTISIIVLSILVSVAYTACATNAGLPAHESGESPAPAPAAVTSADETYRGKTAKSEFSSAPLPSGAPRPTSSGLKAGFSDDNAQFNYFVDFLEKYKHVPHYAYDISNRMSFTILDKDNKPIANARIELYSVENGGKGSKLLETGVSTADGNFRFYPLELAKKADPQTNNLTFVWAVITYNQTRIEKLIDCNGIRNQEIVLSTARTIKQPVPLDIVFVMDTTGSMGEEIERLRATIQIINDNIITLKPRPAVRFGMVLYRDKTDEYVTKVVPLTDNLDQFEKELATVKAGGGGDRPEDLESALDDTLNKLNWNTDGIRLAFIITDAEAHLDYGKTYTYIDAARDAKNRGIKLYTIGTGGLPLEGEYLLRQISQISNARYIFLTYGEKDESEGGTEGAVSHHTGSNFTSDKLEVVIIKFVREEMAFQSDTPIVTAEEYFEAQKTESQKNEEILSQLFEQALNNLLDYSSLKITKDTPIAILPITAQTDENKAVAEYFSEQILITASKLKRCKLVERKDLQKILEELELQLSGLVDEKNAAKVGYLLGAEVLITGTLYVKDGKYEIFVKLLRVSTGEILAVTRAKIDKKLGL